MKKLTVFDSVLVEQLSGVLRHRFVEDSVAFQPPENVFEFASASCQVDPEPQHFKSFFWNRVKTRR